MLNRLLSPEVQKFIKDHQNDDPFLLSLTAKQDKSIPLKEAIEQIQSYQKAKAKLPSLAKKEQLIWPPSVSVEQASSETTAQFKSSLLQGKLLADLSGGMGVDTLHFASHFNKVHYVEPDQHLCEIARYNFPRLNVGNIDIHHQSAEGFLAEQDQTKTLFDGIYIDPSRRDQGRKVFKIEDCIPNLYDIIPNCITISKKVLVKLSPLIDLSLLTRDFQPSEIWVVAVKNEVKEVLFLLPSQGEATNIHAIDLDQQGKYSEFAFDREMELQASSEYSHPLDYLYEPNAAIMKAGAFKLMGQKYSLKKLHQHSHLYTSNDLVMDFPGKILKIKDILTKSNKDLARHFPGGKVNVITRNYPLTANQLKKKYTLTDGGDSYLVGTTLFDGKRVLISCERL